VPRRSTNAGIAFGLIALLLVGCARIETSGGGQSSTGEPGPTPDAEPNRSAGQDCLAPSTVVTAVKGEAPAPVCLRLGDHVTVTAPPSANQPWQAMTSDDESIVGCTSRQLTDGGLEATCTALALGTTTVSTMTAPYAGDPRGPQQSIWRLTITVMPK
jgi:hypothetical protein